jgi:hypothetical protein
MERTEYRVLELKQYMEGIQKRREIAQSHARPLLEEWVAEQVEKCREACCGEITRQSAKASDDMDPELYELLCQALEVDGLRLADLANMALRKHDGVPSLVRFNAVRMSQESIRLLYKY